MLGSNLSKQLKGTILCVAGVFILSPDSLAIRKLGVCPDLTVQFYRYLIAAITILSYIIHEKRQSTLYVFKNAGYVGALSGLIWGAANFLFTYAVQNTAAANVLVINASNAIFASIFAYLILGETIPTRTLVAIIVCFGAIALVFSTELSSEGGSSTLYGNIAALFSAMCLGLFLPLCRLKSVLGSPQPTSTTAPTPGPGPGPGPATTTAPDTACTITNPSPLSASAAINDVEGGQGGGPRNSVNTAAPTANSPDPNDENIELLSYNVMACLWVSILALILGADVTAVDANSGWLLVVNGVFIIGLSFCMLVIGPSFIPAPEVSLFFLIETVVGPLWVFLGGFEEPPRFTVYGGILLFLALAGNR
jgi:drug/metabolite transporter (DMT)-like permease